MKTNWLEQPVSSFTVTGCWVNEQRYPPRPPVFCDVDGYWWRCVSHWGPVVCTGVLVA